MKEFDTGTLRRQAEREAGTMAVQFIRTLEQMLVDRRVEIK
jgi:hypothetical protein